MGVGCVDYVAGADSAPSSGYGVGGRGRGGGCYGNGGGGGVEGEGGVGTEETGEDGG